jgi:anti-sigma factor RsiW
MSVPELHVEEKLLDFAYDELQQREAEEVGAHLLTCEKCSEALAHIRAVRRVAAQLEEAPAPEAGLDSLLHMATQVAKRNAEASFSRPRRWFLMPALSFGALTAALVSGVFLLQQPATPDFAGRAKDVGPVAFREAVVPKAREQGFGKTTPSPSGGTLETDIAPERKSSAAPGSVRTEERPREPAAPPVPPAPRAQQAPPASDEVRPVAAAETVRASDTPAKKGALEKSGSAPAEALALAEPQKAKRNLTLRAESENEVGASAQESQRIVNSARPASPAPAAAPSATMKLEADSSRDERSEAHPAAERAKAAKGDVNKGADGSVLARRGGGGKASGLGGQVGGLQGGVAGDVGPVSVERPAETQAVLRQRIEAAHRVLAAGVRGLVRAQALLALCSDYSALGEHDRAESYCRMLIGEFPTSAEAKAARSRRRPPGSTDDVAR